jgi:hypothetical protein
MVGRYLCRVCVCVCVSWPLEGGYLNYLVSTMLAGLLTTCNKNTVCVCVCVVMLIFRVSMLLV